MISGSYSFVCNRNAHRESNRGAERVCGIEEDAQIQADGEAVLVAAVDWPTNVAAFAYSAEAGTKAAQIVGADSECMGIRALG